MAARPPRRPEDTDVSLIKAVIGSSPGPLLLLDGDLKIVVASRSFGEHFEVDCGDIVGVSLFEIGAGAWNIPQLRSLLTATASGSVHIEAYELDFKRRGRDVRSLIIQAQRLVYEDLREERLLVSVIDATDMIADKKAKTEALAHNAVLLKEVRHRVANSLQIIASVLLQNARKTQSDETRSHLKDAHLRVMSVAALGAN